LQKYRTIILRLSYDNAEVTIDLRRTSILSNILRTQGFYRAMLCIRGSHGPVSVRLSVCLSVCPSVRPSVTSRCSTKTDEDRITHTKPHDSPGISGAKDLREIRPDSPPTRAPNADGVGQNRRLLTNSRLYLENGTR